MNKKLLLEIYRLLWHEIEQSDWLLAGYYNYLLKICRSL